MKFLDQTFASPAENLACDEALLDAAECGESGEVLRIWESPQPFVVVGYANRIASEVNVQACKAKGIPVLRRCSGGGTVLQGPGCLSYALVLANFDSGPMNNISSTNRFIMERNRAVIEDLLSDDVAAELATTIHVVIRGHTDLALITHLPLPTDPRKFSGNSQRRRRSFVLFHGTFLLDFDLSLAGECLLMPSRQPEYRADRTHDDFLINLKLPPDTVKRALCEAWSANSLSSDYPSERIASLISDKYSTTKWNYKF